MLRKEPYRASPPLRRLTAQSLEQARSPDDPQLPGREETVDFVEETAEQRAPAAARTHYV